MPWSTFKSSMAAAMSTWSYGNNIQGFATKLTMEYDMAVKSGHTNLSLIGLNKGQTDTMKSLLITQLTTQQKSKSKTLLEICGPAIIAYWTGATINLIPPILPCIGAMINIAAVYVPVTNAGTWTPIPNLPCNNVNIWLDEFIICAKQHMTTVAGIHNCICLYPGAPPPVAPGVLPWFGYTVP